MTWRKVVVEKVLEKAVTQSLEAYIERRLVTVTELVALCSILEVCNRETDYEGGWRRREP